MFFCYFQYCVFYYMIIVGNIVVGEYGKWCKVVFMVVFQCFDENIWCGVRFFRGLQIVNNLWIIGVECIGGWVNIIVFFGNCQGNNCYLWFVKFFNNCC